MLTLETLQKFFKGNNLPAFHAKQVMEAIYQKGVESFDDITGLPKAAREKLAQESASDLIISCVTPIAHEKSKDGSTEKVLFELSDGNKVEGVLMRFNDGRKTVCISSEVGCPLKCTFCASGTLTFKRSLTAEEIADQVIYFSRKLRREGARLDHVVYMGIGEPFRNYANVVTSLKIIMDPAYVGLGARHITVSTAGIVEKIKQFAEEPFQVNLAVSLHAPTQELRQKIMPIAIRYSLNDLLDAIRFYIEKTNRRVSFEYVMLKGINDSDEYARQLADLCKGLLVHVNLIPYNATDIDKIEGSERERIRAFQEILTKNNIPATTRVSLGQDIAAACGQLANKAQKSL